MQDVRSFSQERSLGRGRASNTRSAFLPVEGSQDVWRSSCAELRSGSFGPESREASQTVVRAETFPGSHGIARSEPFPGPMTEASMDLVAGRQPRDGRHFVLVSGATGESV